MSSSPPTPCRTAAPSPSRRYPRSGQQPAGRSIASQRWLLRVAANVSSVPAGRDLGYESGGHGGRDDVMPAVMPTAHDEQFLGVNGMRLADRRREPDPAAITNGHDVLTPDVKQDSKVILTKRPEPPVRRSIRGRRGAPCATYPIHWKPWESIPIECNATQWIGTEWNGLQSYGFHSNRFSIDELHDGVIGP